MPSKPPEPPGPPDPSARPPLPEEPFLLRRTPRSVTLLGLPGGKAAPGKAGPPLPAPPLPAPGPAPSFILPPPLPPPAPLHEAPRAAGEPADPNHRELARLIEGVRVELAFFRSWWPGQRAARPAVVRPEARRAGPARAFGAALAALVLAGGLALAGGAAVLRWPAYGRWLARAAHLAPPLPAPAPGPR